MFLMKWQNNKKGISIVEILIVIALVVIALGGLLGLATFSLRVSNLVRETTQANSLAQETLEAVRNFRDGTDWDTNGLGTSTVGVSYYLRKTADNPPKWELVLGEEVIDGFTRKVVFNEVYRDINDDIVETGGTSDPKTRKVTATVSWKDEEVEIITYLTNWR
jgi:type II secretory pathway pseudopilin PulG